MGRRNLMTSTILVVSVFAVLLVVGTAISSEPSEAIQESGRVPTTTTTTEPPPEGVTIVRLENGVFNPSNLRLDLEEIQTVQWVNEDDVEYIIVGTGGIFESPPIGPGDTYEFDFSTLEPGIYRYNATVGFQRIPGSVDTRPEQ